MSSKLFESYTIKNVTLNNRIVMSPMCMLSALNGYATEWHTIHYATRAIGGVGLVMIESTAITPEGRINQSDLGIWGDEYIPGLKKIADAIHAGGSKAGIQISHAGRKAKLDAPTIAPTAIAFPGRKVPAQATVDQIHRVIMDFQEGVRRAKEAGFDIIELHAAHGFLINEFLSPLTNKRTDQYGGDANGRYQFLKETIDAVNTVWGGPLFVRVSANEYNEGGNSLEQFVEYARKMKAQGVDLIDCSAGGVVPAKIDVYPGYQVRSSEYIRQGVGIATAAVGLITKAVQAEEIIGNQRADLVFLGRELLRNPYWAFYAAEELNADVKHPSQYGKAF